MAAKEEIGRLWEFQSADRKRLALWFAVGMAVLVVFAVTRLLYLPPATVFAAAIIIIFSGLPAWLMLKGHVVGIPIFPVYAILYIWLFALPLLAEHPKIGEYSEAEQIMAALVVSAHLFIGTLFWWILGSRPALSPPRIYLIPEHRGNALFIALLSLGALVWMAIAGGWFRMQGAIPFPPEVYKLLQRVVIGLSGTAVFVCSFQMGRRRLSNTQLRLFLALIALIATAQTANLYLRDLFWVTVATAVGFTMGRKQIPWAPLMILIVILSLLHQGKGPMRQKYWKGTNYVSVQPWNYPEWYGEWFIESLKYRDKIAGEQATDLQALVERGSLVHLYLLVQEQTSAGKPLLYGETYRMIPPMLIPRVLYPQKASTMEGLYRLSIYYELQTRESTRRLTIGWGLLNESLANFGIAGVLMLGVAFGSIFGWISRATRHLPLFSFRTLSAFLVLGMVINVEFSMSVFVTALFQAFIPLVALRFFFMKPAVLQKLKGNPSSSATERLQHLSVASH